jgi:hypothetical protein
VGQLLDNLNNLARKPEFQRTLNSISTRIRISNTKVRSKQILLSQIKETGISLIREDQAEFGIKFNSHSRIQSASLEIDVQVDEKLMDLLQGITYIDGMGGRGHDLTDQRRHRNSPPHGAKTQQTKGQKRATPPHQYLDDHRSIRIPNTHLDHDVYLNTAQLHCRTSGAPRSKGHIGAILCYKAHPRQPQPTHAIPQQQCRPSQGITDYIRHQDWKTRSHLPENQPTPLAK